MEKLIRQTVLSLFGCYKPKDLRMAIENNTDLAKVLRKNSPPQQLGLYKILAMPFSSQKGKLNNKLVKKWLLEEKEDLFEELINNGEKGEMWLEMNLEHIKILLWG